MWLLAAAIFGILALLVVIGGWLNHRYGRGAMSPMSETMEREVLHGQHKTWV